MTLTYIETGKPVQVGDKVPGKRLSKYYAHVESIHSDHVVLLYNGDIRSVHVSFDVIDAEMR